MAVGQEYGPELRARIDPLMTGVGVVEAAAAVAHALATLPRLPELVVSLGSSGSRRKPVGQVFQISSVAWRDIDASPLGFARGVTPFLDLAPVQVLETPIPDWPTATLSSGSDVVTGDAYDRIDADLVEMETWGVLRACQRAGVAMIGLRGVSDGPGELTGIHDWTALLGHLDRELARAVDALDAAA